MGQALRGMVSDKVRIRFCKSGDLRLISHHDLMRTFERMLRRAGLPYHSTSGFNPKPRLVFASPLPLGVQGAEEVVELELDETLPPEEVCRRLASQAPAGLEIRSARRVAPGTTAHVCLARYRIPLPPGRYPDLSQRIGQLLDQPSCLVERRQPRVRRIDVRPFLAALRVTGEALEMDLRVTPGGTARPDDVLGLLGLAELLRNGGVLERTGLDLEDETNEPLSAAQPQRIA
jgi:radical SAM-linked protein